MSGGIDGQAVEVAVPDEVLAVGRQDAVRRWRREKILAGSRFVVGVGFRGERGRGQRDLGRHRPRDADLCGQVLPADEQRREIRALQAQGRIQLGLGAQRIVDHAPACSARRW